VQQSRKATQAFKTKLVFLSMQVTEINLPNILFYVE